MIRGLQGEEWKFIQKYLKEKISCGVGRNRGKFARWSSNFAPWFELCEIPTLWTEEFRTLISIVRNYPSAWCSCLPKAISSSFQLQIIHCLNRWILDFLSFEMVYSMYKMDLGKWSKSAKEDYSCCLCFLHSVCFSSLLHSFTWLVLMIQKAVKTLKIATNMIRSHC